MIRHPILRAIAALLILVELVAPALGKPRYVTIAGYGPGQPISAPVAPVTPTLATLSVSPVIATAGTAYSGTISGKTAGSTIAATSSDGTVLSVTGTTLGGTFAGAGPPTVTLTETLAGATNSPRATPVGFTVSAAGPGLFALSTPILYEGDSNTAPGYQILGWQKRALAKLGGRFYQPVGGNFAVPGAYVRGAANSTNAGNAMDSRQSAVVAKISALKSAGFARVVVAFQIGTNSSANVSADISALTTIVSAYKSAGAYVVMLAMPKFGAASTYADSLNAAGANGTIGADLFVDTNALATVNTTHAAGTTHYDGDENDEVGQAFADALASRTVTASIYTDPIVGLTADDLPGTGGTLGTATSGTLPTGWAASRISGDGTLTAAVNDNDLDGRRTMDLTVAAGAQDSLFAVSASKAFPVSTGDVVDGWATVQLVSATDAASIQFAGIGIAGGTYPYSIDTLAFVVSEWANARVWRAFPINQPASASTIGETVYLRVASGKTARIKVSGIRYVVREVSAAVAPANTVAPVMSAATVGGTPGCSDGSWTGSPAPTYSRQFYLGETPIASTYVFQAGDAGAAVKCFVTATSSAGSSSAQSNSVTVQAAATTTTLDPTVNFVGQLAYSNGNLTVTNTSGSNLLNARSIAGKTSGKAYVECVPGAVNAFACGVGSSATAAANDGTRAILTSGGTALYNGTNSTVFSFAPADVVQMWIDYDAKLIWWRKNGAGNYNNNASANPQTGAGGLSFANISGNIHAVAVVAAVSNSQATLRFASGSWSYPAQAGAFGQLTP